MPLKPQNGTYHLHRLINSSSLLNLCLHTQSQVLSTSAKILDQQIKQNPKSTINKNPQNSEKNPKKKDTFKNKSKISESLNGFSKKKITQNPNSISKISPQIAEKIPRKEENDDESTKKKYTLSQYLETSNLINTVCALLHNKPWSAQTEEALAALKLDVIVVGQVLRLAKMNPSTTMKFFQWLLTNPQFSPNKKVCYAMLRQLGKTEEAEVMLNDVVSGKYKRVHFRLQDLMQLHFMWRDFCTVENLWSQIKHDYLIKFITPNLKYWNTYLEMLGCQGSYHRLRVSFSELLQEGLVPDSRTYTVIVKCLVDMGKPEVALEVFRAMSRMRVKRNVKQCEVLILEFCKKNDVRTLVWLIEEMEFDGFFSRNALCCALDVLEKAGMMEEVKRFRETFLKDVPFQVLDESENSGCSDFGDVDDEDAKISDVLERWVSPYLIAEGLSKWEPENVEALEKANLKWDSGIFCKVLRSFRDADDAWKFYMWVACGPGFRHNAYSVTWMVVVLARGRMVEEATGLLLRARREKLKLPVAAMRLIFEAFGRLGESKGTFREYHRLEDFGLHRSFPLCCSVIHTLLECKMTIKASYIVNDMMKMNVRLDVQRLVSIMDHFASMGDLKTMRILFQWMKQNDSEPDAQVYRILIMAYLKNGNVDTAYRFFEQMKKLSLKLDYRASTSLANSLWEEGKLKEAALVEEENEYEEDYLPKVLPDRIWRTDYAALIQVYDLVMKNFP